MSPPKRTVEVIEIPQKFADLAERRTRGFIRPFIYLDDLPLSFLMRSCYLQGASDMAEATEKIKRGKQ